MRGNQNVDEQIYPLGRARLEPVGIVVVASLMGMASLQVVLESLYRILRGIQKQSFDVPDVSWFAIAMLLSTIALKLGLYAMCRRVSFKRRFLAFPPFFS
jgi:divalent metal cation (Fe/Co/Zn/Cd) transporter